MKDYRRTETAVALSFNTALAPSSALAASDFAVYRGTTKRSSTAGFTITNTGSVVGSYTLTVDITDDTDAGFYQRPAEYHARFDTSKTVGGQSIDGGLIGEFSIEKTTALQPEPETAELYLRMKAGKVDLMPEVYDVIKADLATEGSLVALANVVSQFYSNEKVAADAIKAVVDAINTIVSSGVHGNAALKAPIDVIDGIVDTILVDTAVIGTPAGASIAADIAAISTLISALNDLSAVQVNAEVSDVMKTDTITLPGQTPPPLTPTIEQAIAWLYKVLRNRKRQSSTSWELYADDETTVDAKATVSDDATYVIKQEIVSGP